MSRSVPWRNGCPDGVSWHQDQALNTAIYILRETGPTGFLLKEEGETKKFRVFLGDPHSCTCPAFKKENDLCKHICWILLKKFRLDRQNQVSWQKGLVEREINQVLRGLTAPQKPQKPSALAKQLALRAGKSDGDGDGEVEEDGAIGQRPIGEDDVCPICQEELLAKHLPVTYCKHGCGNSVHIKCMKVWAEHQQSTGEKVIKCPFCREDFGPFSLLKQEFRNTAPRHVRADQNYEHLGTVCKRCRACPITGKCYKCSVCVEYHLCQACFNTPTHQEHSFQYREKCVQRWRPAARSSAAANLPQALVENLQNRDISEGDYDLLLQLDRSAGGELSDLTEATIRSLPCERVKHASALLAPGQQCRVCLQRYSEGQQVRRLPCRHKFHRDCIDNWLLHQHPTCPVDGTSFSNESIEEYNKSTQRRRHQQLSSTAGSNIQPAHSPASNSAAQLLALEIPGIGIARLPNSALNNDSSARSEGRLRGQPLQRRDSLLSQRSEPDINVSGRRCQNSSAGGATSQQLNNNPALQSYPVQRGIVFSTAVLLNRSSSRDASPSEHQRESRCQPQSPAVRHRELNSTSSSHVANAPDLFIPSVPLSLYSDFEQPPSSEDPAESRNRASELIRIPQMEAVPPSIPCRHDGGDLDLNITNTTHEDSAPVSAAAPVSSSRKKPPTGSHGLTGQEIRRTRVRGRAPISTGTRSRSASRERTPLRPAEQGLHIGHNPDSVAGFTANVLVQSSPKARRGSSGHSRHNHEAANSGHRWGLTRKYSGDNNEIQLAGNSLTHVHISDT